MNLKNNWRMLKGEFTFFYKNKGRVTILAILFIIILFAPKDLVFSQNIMGSGFADSFIFRAITAGFLIIAIIVNVLLLRIMKNIWDSMLFKK